MRLRLRILAAGVALLIGPVQAFAVTRTWDGGGADNKWNTPANWSDDTRPNPGDAAVFDGTSTKNADIGTGTTINSLQIRNGYTGTVRTKSGASLYIGTGSYLQQAGTFRSGTGTVIVRGNLTLTGGTLISSTRFLSVTGNFTQTGSSTYTPSNGTLVLASPSARTLKIHTSIPKLAVESTLETGLLAYWKFDEDPFLTTFIPASGDPAANVTQTSTVYDYSGNGWNLTMPSTYWTAASNWPIPSTDAAPTSFPNPGSMRSFQSRSWMRNLNGPTTSTAVTLAFWIKPGSDLSTVQVPLANLAGNFGSINDTYYTHFVIISNTWYFGGPACDATAAPYSTSLIGDGDWHHIVFAKSGTTCRVYLDGSLLDTITVPAASTFGTGLMIGNYSNFDLLGFPNGGNLDDVRIYSRALSTSEITELYGGHYAARTGGSALTLGAALTVTGSLANHNGTLTQGSSTVTATNTTITNYGTISKGSARFIHPSSFSTTDASVGGSIQYTLNDTDQNLDGTSRDAVTIRLPYEGETVTLTETGNATSIFIGSIPVAHAAQQDNNNQIEYNDRCSYTVLATFVDSGDNADGSTISSTVTDPGAPCTVSGGGGGGGGSRGGGGGGGGGGAGRSAAPRMPLITPPPKKLTTRQQLRQQRIEARKMRRLQRQHRAKNP